MKKLIVIGSAILFAVYGSTFANIYTTGNNLENEGKENGLTSYNDNLNVGEKEHKFFKGLYLRKKYQELNKENKELLKKIKELKEKYKNKTITPEEKEELKKKLMEFKSLLVKNNIRILPKNYKERYISLKQNRDDLKKTFLERKKEIRDYFKDRKQRLEYKNKKEEIRKEFIKKIKDNRDKIRQVVEEGKYQIIKEKTKKKIEMILENKIFKRLEGKSTEFKKERLRKILVRIEKIMNIVESKLNENRSNIKLKIKFEILKFIKEKINKKLNDLYNQPNTEDLVNETIGDILGQ